MKIKIIIISFIFLTLFSSCSKKTVEVNQNNGKIAKQINDFIFELARYSLTGECDLKNPEKYFFPKELNTFTGRYYFENGNQYLLIEKYFPQKRGLIECSGIYNPSNDNASWVDSLLIELEEERIGLSISEMEDEYSMGQYDGDNFDYESTINVALDENVAAEEIIGKDSKLRIMQFDKEILIPNENVFIEVNGSNVNRKFYNEDYKLIKIENWEISGSNNSKLLQTEEYSFEKGAKKPYKKTVKNEKQYSIFFYNENGESVKSEKHIFTENDKDILVSAFEWSYNENKVTSETNFCYYYDKDYKKLDYVFEKKYIYKYNDFKDVLSEEENDKIPADFTYFEDNVLKMKNKYTAELGTYTSQVFFENKLAVKTYFNKYKRQKEVYTVGEEVIRVKEYE